MKINLEYAKTETPDKLANKKKWFESEHDLRSRIKNLRGWKRTRKHLGFDWNP